jgi:hypothetical protein
MSWDIFAQDFPNVASVKNIPNDFRPKSIGNRQEILAKIKTVVPFADFSDPSWGKIDTKEFSIEINIPETELVDCVAFHVRGGGLAGSCVAAILKTLELRAVDSQTGEFFDIENPQDSFEQWQRYRDQCLQDNNSGKFSKILKRIFGN